MGARIRSFPWADSVLGPVEQWPESLKTAVRICLASRYPIVIWWGKSALTQFYNDAYIPMLGASKHPEFLGQSARDCWNEIWHIVGPMVESVFETGKATWSEDFLLVLKRNLPREECYFTFSYSPLPDDAGSIQGIFCAVTETTGRVIGERRLRTLRDMGGLITAAKTAEEACKIAATTLAENPADLPFCLIYLLDHESKTGRLMASTGLAAGSLAAPAEIDLKQANQVWPLHRVLERGTAELVTDLEARFGKTPGGPWPDSSRNALILPIFSPGHIHPAGFMIAGISPLRPLDSDYRSFLDLVTGHLATAVANARAYEEERRRAEALAELDRAKTQFFSNVSHEFRTPLTLMLGPIEEMLTDAAKLPAGHREKLEIAHRNSLRLLKLVNSLLDFSRIEAGRLQASFEPVDLATLTNELASTFRSAMETAGLDLVVDCPPLPEQVYVDPEMWEQIVLNLLSNAFKFTLKGSVTVSVRAAGSSAQLTISDTGSGIPESELPHIFERFHRVEGAPGRSYEGTGIGLALIQELVKLHGGTVSVESKVDQGSAFRVSVPFGTSHLPPQRIQLAPSPRASSAVRSEAFAGEAMNWLGGAKRETNPLPQKTSGAKNNRILLVDDNADMREYVIRILGSGYEVIPASNGEEALEMIRAGPHPDLILSDIMMPKLDGIGLLHALRSDPATTTLPVIFLSARAGEEARIEGMHAGADDYLIKPFTARELLARVESHLKLAHIRDEAAEALRFRTAQFETLLNNAPLGVFLIDADFRIRQVNPVALPAFGEIPGGVLGRDFEEVMHLLWEKEYADEVVSIYRRTLETGESFFTPERAEVRADRGTVEHYEWRLDRIHLPDGRFGIVCYFRDVSERKRAEHNANLLASIVESSDDAIISKNLDGIITSWNGGAERLFGYTAAEAIGRSITILIPSDRLDEEREIIERLKRGERVDHFETIRVRKDGATLNISLTISPVKDAQGRVVGASKVARDITERLRHEAALKEANAALTRANDDLQQFAYSASHDLQEPLRMVASYSELLQRRFGDKLGPTGAQYISYAVQGAVRMESLLKGLRTYTQVSANESEAITQVDAGEIFRRTLASLEIPIKESGAQITQTELPRVKMREFQLEQLFQNLIGNALRYRTQESPRIHVAAVRRDREWLFSIQDNGIGIEPRFKEQIFGIFKRLHSNAEYPGTGMGLAICQRVVERAGGRIWVESELGRGSTFFFTIPA